MVRWAVITISIKINLYIMFKSSFYELNDTPVSNTIFIIEKTPPPLGVTGRIGLFKKGKRDEIEVVGC